jgi:hypothetical protein
MEKNDFVNIIWVIGTVVTYGIYLGANLFIPESVLSFLLGAVVFFLGWPLFLGIWVGSLFIYG